MVAKENPPPIQKERRNSSIRMWARRKRTTGRKGREKKKAAAEEKVSRVKRWRKEAMARLTLKSLFHFHSALSFLCLAQRRKGDQLFENHVHGSDVESCPSAHLFRQLCLNLLGLFRNGNPIEDIDLSADIHRVFFLILFDMDPLHQLQLAAQQAIQEIPLEQADPFDLRQGLQNNPFKHPCFDIADKDR